MTVCVAALFTWYYGENDIGRAVLTASDRMMTASDIQYEPPNFKVSFLSKSVVLLVAGDMAVQSEAITKLLGHPTLTDPNPKVTEVAEIYAANIKEIRLRRAVDTYLAPLGLNEKTFLENQKHMLPQLVFDLTNELRTFTIDVDALVVGCDGQTTAYIHQIDRDGIVSHHHDINFAAIGIGSDHAKSHFMFSRYPRILNYYQALPIVYGAKRRAEVAPGVGKETDLFLINRNGWGAVHELFVKDLEQDYETAERRRQKGS